MISAWRWLGIVMLGLLTGCAGAPEGTLTVAVGGAPAEVDYWERLATEFSERTGTPVQVRRQPTDSNLRRQELVIALKARQPDPDVFLLDVAWLAQFAASDWLEPLDANVENSAVDLGAFFPRVVRLADRYEGTLVALPVYVDAGLLYYRKDLLAEADLSPPATWADLVRAAKEVQAAQRAAGKSAFNGFLWQGAQYEGLMCTFLEFTVSHGGGVEISKGAVTLDTPENRRALQLMHDLIHVDKVSPPGTYTEMKEEEVRMAFQRGNALFERNWPYAWALHQQADSPVKGQVGIQALPHAPEHASAATLGGWHIGVSRFSDATEASWQFVQHVVSYETQKSLALELGWNPGRQDVYQDEEVLAELPHFETLRDVFDHAYPRPMLPYYTQVSEVIQRYVNAALANEMTPEEALGAAQREAQDIVARYER